MGQVAHMHKWLQVQMTMEDPRFNTRVCTTILKRGNFISPLHLHENFIYTQTCIKNIVHYAFNTCTLGIHEINLESRVIYEINPFKNVSMDLVGIYKIHFPNNFY